MRLAHRVSQAPKSGQLKVGYDADFVGLSTNPLEDVGVLAQPEQVSHVWKMGKPYKSAGKSIGILDSDL